MTISVSLLKETSNFIGNSPSGEPSYQNRCEKVVFNPLNRDRTVAFHGGRVRFTPDGYAVPAFFGDGALRIDWSLRDAETNSPVEGSQIIQFVDSMPVGEERVPSFNLRDLRGLSFRADCGLPWSGLIVDFDKSTF